MQHNTATPTALAATLSPIADVLGIGNTVLQLENITQDRLAAVATGGIAELIDLLDGIAARIKSAQGEVSKTLSTRYGEHAKSQLLASGRDTGTTHLIDGDYDVTVEVGKDVKWDAKGLAELVTKIDATGGDAREYVEIKYSVSEAKFKAWPQSLRAPFEALRTVTPKAAKFVLRRIGEKK